MYKIKRAIILAAGQGTRLRPYTDSVPKSLLQIAGKPIIERTIEILLSKGIDDITIVTGYLHDKFEYLKSKYGVSLVINYAYDAGSNLISLQCAVSKIEDCVIIDGDLLLKPDAILNEVQGSGYAYVKRQRASEWAIIFNNSNRIKTIVADSSEKHDFNALYSISYWVGKTALKYQHAIFNASDSVRYADDIAITMPDLYGYKVRASDLIEIDTVEDYEHVKRTMEKAR